MNAPALILQLSHLIKQVFWVNYSPGVYFFRLNDLDYTDYDAIFTSGLVANDLEFVIAVMFDGVVFVEVTSIVNCQALQSSFYCSADELWIHSPLDADPYNHTVSGGKATQIRRGGSTDEDLIYMEDRLLSVPNISKSLSDIFNSKIIFSGGGVTLNNADGFYDTFLEDEEIIGNKAKQFVKHPETGEMIQAFSGFSESGDLSTTELSLSIKDDKESLNVPIPPNVFTLAVYPYLDPENVDKPIPIAFGKCRNVELICSNELEPAAGTFYFPCADTMLGQLHDVTAVLVDGAAVAYTKLLATNRFSLSSAVYAPGQKVTANIEGYEDSTGACMRNACDILKKLFIYFCGFGDTSDFFDIWDTANAYNTYIFINEIKKFWEIAQIICKSSFLNLILNNNGTYSAFVNSKTEDFIREIRNYELVKLGTINYDSDKLLSSVLIKYNQDHAENKWLQKKVNTGEAVFFETYNQYAYKEFEANLDNETDAGAYGAAILDYFSTVQKPTKIKMDYLEVRDLIIGKNYKIVFKRPRAPELGTYKVKLISTVENLNIFETECTLQLLEKLADDNELFYFGDCENVLSPSLASDGSVYGPWEGTWARSIFRKHFGLYSWVLTTTHATNDAYVGLHGWPIGDMHGLKQGEPYILELWAYTTAINFSDSYISLGYLDGGGWHAQNLHCEKSNAWHKLTATILYDVATTDIYIHAVITGGSNTTENLIEYGDCENENSVTLDGGYEEDGNVWGRSNNCHSGSFSWQATKDIEPPTEGKVQLAIPYNITTNMHGLMAGKIYTISFWGYAENLVGSASNAYMLLQEYYSGSWHDTHFPYTQKDAWHNIVSVFTINALTTGINLAVGIAGSELSGEYVNLYIDDVSIIEWVEKQFYIDDISMKYERD